MTAKARKHDAIEEMKRQLQRRSQEHVVQLIFGHGMAGRRVVIEGDDVLLFLPNAPRSPILVGNFSAYFGVRV